MACAFWIIVLISLFGRFSATQECSPSVTDKHLTYLDKLIDGQLYSSSWTIAINLLVKGPLTDYCYNKGIVHQLSYLLDNMTFKENSESQKLKVILEDLYTDEIASCTINSDIEKADIIKCSQTINLSPAEILQRVKHSFLVARDFRLDLDIDKECKALYGKCNDDNNNTTKGSQCACPSPTTVITQKSLSGLSEFKSSTYSTSFPHHTTTLIEDMSGTYPHKPSSPPKNSQGIDTSSVIFTDMPTERQPLTNIMDHSYAATTLQPGPNTESSHNTMDLTLLSTEFPKGITQSLHTTITPFQYSAVSQQVNKEPSNSNREGLHSKRVPPTTEGPTTKTYSLKNGDLSFVTKPVGEMLDTTESDFVSHSSKVPMFQKYVSSKEPDIESSSSTVTKIRRSLVDEDEASRAFMRTFTLSTADSGTDLPFLSSLHASFPSIENSLSTSESPQSVSHEKGTEDRNLGWASFYLSSSTLSAPSPNTGLSMSSPGSGVQPLLSEVSQQHPALTAHKGGYTHNIPAQQEVEVAAFISENRENSFPGPNYGSNLLPIIETEQQHNGRKKEPKESNLFTIFTIILTIVGLLCLCGLLYYRYHYRLLKRRLHRDRGLQLPEERPLQIPLDEIV